MMFLSCTNLSLHCGLSRTADSQLLEHCANCLQAQPRQSILFKTLAAHVHSVQSSDLSFDLSMENLKLPAQRRGRTSCLLANAHLFAFFQDQVGCNALSSMHDG